ncbi:cUMP-AMP-activated phospholipase [Anaerolineales bacterium]|jgi:NTE family protein|nr:cUMP-AMP-activated phospholipase [Anaerolineales bacterium]
MRAFVLSGGGSRGALQVGALEVLLEHGISPDLLVGVSAGSVNAALLASTPTLDGVHAMKQFWLDDLPKHTPALNRGEAILRLALGRNSLFNEEARQYFVQNWEIGKQRMGDFVHPRLYITAVRLSDGEQRIFGDDPDDQIGDAVLSSTALPPLFSPWRVDGSEYVDGGACSNLPLRAAVERGADEIYALNLVRPFDNTGIRLNGIFSIGVRALGSLLDYTTELEIEVVRQTPTLQLHLMNLKAKTAPPVWDLSHTEEMIETGRQVAEQYLAVLNQQKEVLHVPAIAE